MPETKLPHDHGQPIEQKLGGLPSPEGFQMVADLYKQLGDPTRLRIFGCSATARSASSTSPPWWG